MKPTDGCENLMGRLRYGTFGPADVPSVKKDPASLNAQDHQRCVRMK